MKERLLLEQRATFVGLYPGFFHKVVAYFIDQDIVEITEREVNRGSILL